ncbi:MFS transporter [Bacillus sp. Marseille-Q3570]|uniref:MFS transporter n=1 Tax=Bacillus sp. Marseille-Q3570 TaxID=2963522 RepID=UPI0021B80870|nr:MFS transporter [Bacillus sp. Marseille-Q3570]
MGNQKPELHGDAQTYIGPSAKRWLALAVVCTATFMTMLDAFIVNVAVPSIQDDLNATAAEIQFIIVGYVIAYGVLLITGGRLGDIFGVKMLFLGGMAGFTLTSLLCGIAPDAMILIISRILQGISAALMVPQVISYIHATFHDHERNIALSIYGAVIGVATIVGQIAGGLLLKLDLFGLGWRAIFLINIPIGIMALLAAGQMIQIKVVPKRERLDLLGVLLLSLGLSLFIFPVVMGHELGWPIWMLICLAGALLFIFVFVYHEQQLNMRGGMPLVNPQLFKDRAFTTGLMIIFAFFSGNAATFFIMSFHLQQKLAFTPLEAAFTYTPLGVGFLFGSMIVPKIIQRFGSRVLLFGAGLMIFGVGIMIGTFYYIPINLKWLDLIPATFVSGIGQGLVATPLIQMILSQINRKDTGTASGMLSTVTVVAQGAGVSLIGTLYFTLIKSDSLLITSNHSFIISLFCILFLAIATGYLLWLLQRNKTIR